MYMKVITLLLLNLVTGVVYAAPPKLTVVSPSVGTTAGGTVITLQGLRFAGAKKITVATAAGMHVEIKVLEAA
jgi:hypothetical protein